MLRGAVAHAMAGLTLWLASCSKNDSHIECGEGTVLKDGTCIVAPSLVVVQIAAAAYDASIADAPLTALEVEARALQIKITVEREAAAAKAASPEGRAAAEAETRKRLAEEAREEKARVTAEKKRLVEEAREEKARVAAEKRRLAEEAREEKGRVAEVEWARVESERARAANLLRGRVHLRRLSEEMARAGFSGRFEIGDTEDDVWFTGGLCTQSVLDDLASRMKSSFSSFGFRRIRCLSYSVSLN